MKITILCDTTLVLRAQQSDISAFGELVERLRESIQRQCYQAVGNWDDAEDLSQEAFVRAYQKLDQLIDPARFYPWLKKITVNLCRDFLRDPARRVIVDEIPEQAVDFPDINDLPLAGLPEETRRCVMLYYEAGCSYEEIARMLGTSVPAVKARLGRAKDVLRNTMRVTHTPGCSPFTHRVLETVKRLQSEQPDERLHAARDLQQGLATDRTALLLQQLRGERAESDHPTAWEQMASIRGAIRRSRRYRTPEVCDALAALLHHPSYEVRLAAVGGLLSQGDQAAVPALQHAVDDPTNPREVITAASQVIVQLAQQVPPPLPAVEPRQLRHDLEQAMGEKRGRVELMQRFIASLRETSPKIRRRAALALGDLGDKRAVSALITLLQHDEVAVVQRAAADALGTLRSRRAVPALMQHVMAATDLREELPTLLALGQIGDPRAWPAVLWALEHGSISITSILSSNGVIDRLVTRENLPLLKETIGRMRAALACENEIHDARREQERQAHYSRMQHLYGTALSQVAEPAEFPELLAAFDCHPRHAAVATALVRLAEPSLLEPMRQHLLAGHSVAAPVLAALGAPGRAVFMEALRSPKADVRAIALAFIGDSIDAAVCDCFDDAVLHLIDELAQHDRSTVVRLRARAVVQRLAESAASARSV